MRAANSFLPLVQIPSLLKGLVYPIQIRYTTNLNPSTQFLRFNSEERMREWNQTFGEEDSSQQTTVGNIFIEEVDSFAIKMKKPRVQGRGRNEKIIDTEIRETEGINYYIPPDGMCLRSCFDFVIKKEGIPFLFPFHVLYAEFCFNNKIVDNVFPMCKVGKFIDFIFESTGIMFAFSKYNPERQKRVPIRVCDDPNPYSKYVLIVEENHFCLMWDKYAESLKIIQRKDWIVKKNSL